MPSTTTPPADYFYRMLQRFDQGIRALSQRVTTTHRDSSQSTTDPTTGLTDQGPVVMHIGQIPNGLPDTAPRFIDASRPLHGVQWHDTTTGQVVMHIGTQPDATHGLWTHDASMKPVHKVGEQSDTTYGMWSLDDNGHVILKTGQVKIGSTVYYGEAVYDTAGHLVGMLGQLPDGNVGFALFSSGGTEVLELNSSGLQVSNGSGDVILTVGDPGGDPGMAIYSAAGVLQTQVGELPDGTYGVAQRARQGVASGEMIDLGLLASPASASDPGAETTSATSYQNVGPSVTCDVGSSGVVKIDATALVSVASTGATAAVGLFIDGVLQDDILALENNTGGGVGVTAAGTVLTTLSPGTHTFDLRYKSSSLAVSCSFTGRTIIVQPY